MSNRRVLTLTYDRDRLNQLANATATLLSGKFKSLKGALRWADAKLAA